MCAIAHLTNGSGGAGGHLVAERILAALCQRDAESGAARDQTSEETGAGGEGRCACSIAAAGESVEPPGSLLTVKASQVSQVDLFLCAVLCSTFVGNEINEHVCYYRMATVTMCMDSFVWQGRDATYRQLAVSRGNATAPPAHRPHQGYAICSLGLGVCRYCGSGPKTAVQPGRADCSRRRGQRSARHSQPMSAAR